MCFKVFIHTRWNIPKVFIRCLLLIIIDSIVVVRTTKNKIPRFHGHFFSATTRMWVREEVFQSFYVANAEKIIKIRKKNQHVWRHVESSSLTFCDWHSTTSKSDFVEKSKYQRLRTFNWNYVEAFHFRFCDSFFSLSFQFCENLTFFLLPFTRLSRLSRTTRTRSKNLFAYEMSKITKMLDIKWGELDQSFSRKIFCQIFFPDNFILVDLVSLESQQGVNIQ